MHEGRHPTSSYKDCIFFNLMTVAHAFLRLECLQATDGWPMYVVMTSSDLENRSK
jgi:hypothetical protein